MSAEAKPFEMIHLEGMETDADLKVLEHYIKKGPAVTIFVDGEPICAGGVAFIHGTKMGESWGFVGKNIAKHKKAVLILSRKFLDDVFDEYEMRRLQSTCRADIETHIRYLEYMGFEREGLLRRFGRNGEDYIMYARVR